MVIFLKKIKTKDGINSIDIEKIKKNIPAIYKVVDSKPAITYTANHIVVSFICEPQKPTTKTASKPKASSKK